MNSKIYDQLERFAKKIISHRVSVEAKKHDSAQAKLLSPKPSRNMHDKTEKGRVKRGARYQQLRKMRSLLNDEFKKAVRNLKESNKLLDQYASDMKAFIETIFGGNKSPFVLKILDMDKASNAHEFYWGKRRLILNGTGGLSGAELTRYFEESQKMTSEQGKFLHKCFNKDDVVTQLNKILPAHEMTFALSLQPSSQDERPKTIRITLKGCSPKSVCMQIGIDVGQKYRGSTLTPLSESSFQNALNALVQWGIEHAPSYRDHILQNLTELKEKALTAERHQSVYGHTRFIVDENSSLDDQKSSLAQRLVFMKDKHQY